ncbi:MAG: alpha/beta fold hydrolase [Candidatus Omnitrophota bacterium]|nr:alpha/beta fold hydrolase [Candidatus Omnitrophota bacterium]
MPYQRRRWELPDGDFLDVDEGQAEPGSPTLVVLHGLESSSRSSQVVGLLRAASRCRWRGVGVNFRSCSGTLNRLRRSYHAGDTADLAWVIQQVIAEHPGSAILCAGFSLGGNVLLKYLEEQADTVPRHLRAAVAISTPFDLAVSVRAIERGLSRVYMRRLLRGLTRKTLAKLERFPDLVDRRALCAVRTIAEFDALVTAPVHGFPSAAAYWAASSSGTALSRIARPTLLINAQDDPFFPGEALPRESVARNAYLSAEFPKAGGHMGFISGRSPGGATFWAVERAIHFLRDQLPPQDPRTASQTNHASRPTDPSP